MKMRAALLCNSFRPLSVLSKCDNQTNQSLFYRQYSFDWEIIGHFVDIVTNYMSSIIINTDTFEFDLLIKKISSASELVADL